MPENLVSFPASPRVGPAVSHACAVFLERWEGTDIVDGARQLSDLLPEHVPGPLKLVVLRALRQIDVPPFASAQAFRAAVARFAAAEPELRTLSDVRRARRETRVTLEAIAQQASLPVYLLRQLEWGDFRQWQNSEWSERIVRAYARAARLDRDRVLAIVEEERREQLTAAVVSPAPASAPIDSVPLHASGSSPSAIEPGHTEYARSSRRPGRRFGAAAAAVGLFVVGLGVGGAIVQQRSSAPLARAEVPGDRPGPVTSQAPSAVSGARTLPEEQSVSSRPQTQAPAALAPPDRASDQGEGSSGAADIADVPGRVAEKAEPRLLSASAAGTPAFSPSFSNAGSAVFYHRDEGVGTALVKADRDEATGDLRVINIVEDNARNYHVRPSPDGSRIAFDSDRDGERGVYVANADGSDVRRVSGPGFAAVPSWSPDGSILAFVRAERDQRTWNLWLLNLQNNESRRVTDYRYGQPWGASWFPDGRRVAYSHEDRLTVLDLPTGTKRIFKSPRAGRLVRTPAVSPDGRHIVFQVYRDGAWMLDVSDGSMERILTDPTAEEFAWDSSGHRLAFHSRRSGSWSVWIMAGPNS